MERCDSNFLPRRSFQLAASGCRIDERSVSFKMGSIQTYDFVIVGGQCGSQSKQS